MAATNALAGQVQAFRMRLTKLDANGVPTPGASSMYVTSSLVLATITPDYLDGTTLRQANGEGVACVEFIGPDTFLGFNITIQVCQPDPYLMNFLGGCGILTPASGFLGWAAPAIGQIDPTNVSVELWSKRIINGVVADDGYPYYWTVATRMKKMRLGAAPYGNEILAPTFTGILRENTSWYNGPLNDWTLASDKSLQQVPCVTARVPAASASLQNVAST